MTECKQALAQMLQKANITLDVVTEKRIDFKVLQGLKKAYSSAQDAWNVELVKKWKSTQGTIKAPLHFTDFIVWHIDHIFSRYQLRELFKLAGGKTKEQADKAVRHYCDRCAPENRLFISKQDYEQFIDLVCEKITAYVGK